MMNTSKTTREQISAFADGELADNQIDIVITALRQTNGKEAWEDYHQIGDLLRSNEASVELRSDFSARMAARLQAEPTIMAPTAAVSYINRTPEPTLDAVPSDTRRGWKRMAMPGMAVAAATVLALLSTPQIITALKGNAAEATNPANPASMSVVAAAPVAGAITHASVVALASAPRTVPAAVNPNDGVMLRDPNIDEYLLAHQRFSPSMYSTAQFARSSLLANESDKYTVCSDPWFCRSLSLLFQSSLRSARKLKAPSKLAKKKRRRPGYGRSRLRLKRSIFPALSFISRPARCARRASRMSSTERTSSKSLRCWTASRASISARTKKSSVTSLSRKRCWSKSGWPRMCFRR